MNINRSYTFRVNGSLYPSLNLLIPWYLESKE
jgi:hypothetical protein